MLINLSDEPAATGGDIPGHLPGFASTTVQDVHVEGSLLIALPAEVCLDEARARDLGWHSFYGDDGPVLLRSAQATVASTEIDLGRATGTISCRRDVEVKVNLWFSPAGTECGRHNTHDFLEIHTQLSGHGVMEKFARADAPGPYEEQFMSPGATGASNFAAYDGSAFSYPWHQYRAVTDAVWLAIEYHVLPGATRAVNRLEKEQR